VGKTANFHTKHPCNLSGFGRKRTLAAIDEWTVLGVALLELHGRSCTYEQVRAKLVYAIDFAQRKVEQSTVAPVNTDDISALEQRDKKLLLEQGDTSAVRKRKRQSKPQAEKKRKRQARPASGFYGVCAKGKRWQAQINYDSEQHSLG
jgi:hypothetical protein